MKVMLAFKDSVAIERIAICCISAALKEKGHDVRLFILGVTKDEKIWEMMREFRPDVVGFSAMTGEHIALAKLNQELKAELGFYTVFGGPHATFCPDFLNEPGIDAICTGEGDIAFPELLERMEAGEEFWKTPTFHVKYEGEIHKNPLGRLVDDMDTLPFPDRKILYDADPAFQRTSTKYFMAARGCPFECSYCFNVEYNKAYKGKGKIIRCLSPERFIQEIEWVMERYPLSHISMIDDLFILKPRWWLEEFATLFKERIGLTWDCTVRANVVRDELISMLRNAGMTFVWMGVESGDEVAANNLLKRSLSNEQLIEAARVLERNDVKLFTLNIMGLPVEDPFESDLKTLDLNIAMRPAYGGSSILYPFPGSPIEKYVKDRGLMGDNSDYFETYKRASMLKFDSPMVRRRIENLHKLFGIIVSYPSLRPMARFLSGLPLNKLYYILYYLWYGYQYKIKLSPIKWWQEGRIFIGVFMRMVVKT
jgi:anaerobic magnesium-protoporphyrin IX monomethyl ester cyclase